MEQTFLFGAFFTTIFTIIELYIYIQSLYWLMDLEKKDCKCAESTTYEFIKFWIQIYIGITVIMYFINLYYMSNDKLEESQALTIFKAIVAIFSLANIILSIQYIQNLKDEKCTCSENTMREVYFIYNWIKIVFIVLLFVITVASVIIIAFAGGEKDIKIKSLIKNKSSKSSKNSK